MTKKRRSSGPWRVTHLRLSQLRRWTRCPSICRRKSSCLSSSRTFNRHWQVKIQSSSEVSTFWFTIVSSKVWFNYVIASYLLICLPSFLLNVPSFFFFYKYKEYKYVFILWYWNINLTSKNPLNFRRVLLVGRCCRGLFREHQTEILDGLPQVHRRRHHTSGSGGQKLGTLCSWTILWIPPGTIALIYI